MPLLVTVALEKRQAISIACLSVSIAKTIRFRLGDFMSQAIMWTIEEAWCLYLTFIMHTHMSHYSSQEYNECFKL